jgi:hypothetical protein
MFLEWDNNGLLCFYCHTIRTVFIFLVAFSKYLILPSSFRVASAICRVMHIECVCKGLCLRPKVSTQSASRDVCPAVFRFVLRDTSSMKLESLNRMRCVNWRKNAWFAVKKRWNMQHKVHQTSVFEMVALADITAYKFIFFPLLVQISVIID